MSAYRMAVSSLLTVTHSNLTTVSQELDPAASRQVDDAERPHVARRTSSASQADDVPSGATADGDKTTKRTFASLDRHPVMAEAV